jgi:hypothetical protein
MCKKEPKNLHPPVEDEYGRDESLICQPPSESYPDKKGCGYTCVLRISTRSAPPDILAVCPKCKGGMERDWSQFSFSVAARGPGFHETKIGQRRKRDMIRRNEKLAKTQWDNVEPMKLSEGATARNPTEGGVYDPKGPFAKKKAKPIISYDKTVKKTKPKK